MATVEVLAPTGFTLTLRLYALGSDTQAATAPMTEATNRKGLYTATVTGQSGNFHVTIEDASANPLGSGYVWLQDDAGTYRTTEESDLIAAGEPGQVTPLESARLVEKIAYLYKFAINRATNNGSVVNLYDYADVNVDQKAAVSDVAGTVTRAKMTSGP